MSDPGYQPSWSESGQPSWASPAASGEPLGDAAAPARSAGDTLAGVALILAIASVAVNLISIPILQLVLLRGASAEYEAFSLANGLVSLLTGLVGIAGLVLALVALGRGTRRRVAAGIAIGVTASLILGRATSFLLTGLFALTS